MVLHLKIPFGDSFVQWLAERWGIKSNSLKVLQVLWVGTLKLMREKKWKENQWYKRWILWWMICWEHVVNIN